MCCVPQDVDQIGVFRICLDAEQTSANVHTYRQKLVHLRKLQYSLIHNQLPVVDHIEQVSEIRVNHTVVCHLSNSGQTVVGHV